MNRTTTYKTPSNMDNPKNQYIKISDMYKTGFIPFTASDIRIKQGLLPQNISNDCIVDLPVNVNGIKPSSAVCNNMDLYPGIVTQYSYGLPDISDSCQCTIYLKAP